MALIGSSIDPRLFVQDFSGIADAAKIRAAGDLAKTQGIASGLGAVASGVTDYFKQQKEEKKQWQDGVKKLEYAMNLFPDQKPQIEGLLHEMKDENAPISDRAAMAKSVPDLIDMMVQQQSSARQERQLGMQEQEANMRMMAFGDQTRAADNARAAQAAITPVQIDDLLSRIPDRAKAEKYRGVLSNLSPEQQALLVPSIAAELPKPTTKTLKEIPVQGGTQMMMMDEVTGELSELSFAPGKARVTTYGYPGDTTPDSNSAAGIGAFGKLQPNDFALSPDMEQQAREAGIKPGETVAVLMENGDTVTGRWMDRTAQDSDVASGRIKGVTKPLRNRVDFYAPGGVNPYEGMKVKGLARITSGDTALPPGFKPTPPPSPTDQKALADMEADKAKRNEDQQAKVNRQASTLATINKFISPKWDLSDPKKPKLAGYTPNDNLKAATGFGSGISGAIGSVTGGGLVTADPETQANQQELMQEVLESGILEALEKIKPASDTDVKFLKNNRPTINSRPEVWAAYMARLKRTMESAGMGGTSSPLPPTPGFTPPPNPYAAATTDIGSIFNPQS